MGYTQRAIKGISWMSGARFVTRAFGFVRIAVLARLLTPSQFGVFGIATLVLALLETLTETGINVVLIQSKRNLSEYIDTAWVVSIIRGTVISLCIILTTPLITKFFNSPDAAGVLYFMSLVPFIRGFINPAEVVYKKELRFNSEFWFRTSLFAVEAIVSIIVSLMTQSVYSLVWGLLAGAMLEVLLSFILIKPWPKLRIDKIYFKEIFQRGSWVTAYTVFNYIAENGDNIVVGRIMGATSLGLYQMAYKISILPISEISDVVSGVVFPVYAKISEERKRLRAAFLKTLVPVFFGSVLLGLIIYLFPQQIILILLGNNWLSIAPVLQVLALYGILRTLSGPASALFLSLQKQRYVTAMVFVRFATLALVIIPLVSMYGLLGAGYAQVIAVAAELPIMIYFILKIFNTHKNL